MTASTYLGNAILESLLRGAAFPTPARVWLSLHTADPGLNGANEVSVVDWPAYARVDPALGAAVATGFAAAAAKATINAKDLLFPTFNGVAPVTISHFGLSDALVAGNFLPFAVLGASKILTPTDQIIFFAGSLAVSVV